VDGENGGGPWGELFGGLDLGSRGPCHLCGFGGFSSGGGLAGELPPPSSTSCFCSCDKDGPRARIFQRMFCTRKLRDLPEVETRNFARV
jgi:hypothetical protein